MSNCSCCDHPEPRKRFRPLALLFNATLLYVGLLVAGGTLVNTGHPVATEAGHWLQLITFVEPTIHWAQASGFDHMASGLRFLSAGFPIA